MNKIKILGSISPYCKNNHNCPGYMINEEMDKILLDCGPGITSKMNMPQDLKNLNIIISHYHKDHYSDIFSIGYASLCYHRMGIIKDKIKVYIPKVNIGEPGYEDYQLILNNKDNYFEIIPYTKESTLNINDNTITFFETKHSIPNYSAKIANKDHTIVYTGDTGYSNIDKYIEFCRNADILISEATYLESDNVNDENHLHTKEAANIALLADVQLLVLTHFWPEHNKLEYLKEAKPIFRNAIVADENIEIDLSILKNQKQTYKK